MCVIFVYAELRTASRGKNLVVGGSLQENCDLGSGGDIKIHPLITRLVDPEVLKKMGFTVTVY
jgi:hypothetical protein